MKKFVCIILFSIIGQAGVCNPQTSLNSFEIPINAVPPGGVEKTHSGGLSSGAVTAITLGSVFGGLGAIGGLGWYLSKNASGLVCGCASGLDNPLRPIFFKDFCQDFSQYKYLQKALGLIKKSSDRKYIFIADSEIRKKTYNTIIFEIPQDLPNFKIIQVSDGLLESKIIVSNMEIPTKNNYQNGVLLKQGQFSKSNEKLAALITENSTQKKVYAIIIEFFAS